MQLQLLFLALRGLSGVDGHAHPAQCLLQSKVLVQKLQTSPWGSGPHDLYKTQSLSPCSRDPPLKWPADAAKDNHRDHDLYDVHGDYASALTERQCMTMCKLTPGCTTIKFKARTYRRELAEKCFMLPKVHHFCTPSQDKGDSAEGYLYLVTPTDTMNHVTVKKIDSYCSTDMPIPFPPSDSFKAQWEVKEFWGMKFGSGKDLGEAKCWEVCAGTDGCGLIKHHQNPNYCWLLPPPSSYCDSGRAKSDREGGWVYKTIVKWTGSKCSIDPPLPFPSGPWQGTREYGQGLSVLECLQVCLWTEGCAMTKFEFAGYIGKCWLLPELKDKSSSFGMCNALVDR